MELNYLSLNQLLSLLASKFQGATITTLLTDLGQYKVPWGPCSPAWWAWALGMWQC